MQSQTKQTTDTIPAMLTPGEQVASNGALQLLGREIIPAANQRALAMKTATQTKPKKYADGTLTARGVPGLPRLGAGLDPGNGVPGNTAIPGVNRTGNSYSQAPGFRPSPPPVTGLPGYGAGYVQPVQGFEDGTGGAEGVQPPSFIEHLRRMLQAGDLPGQDAPPRRPEGMGARTLDEAKARHEFHNGKPVQHYAVGTLTAKGAADPYYDPDRELKAHNAMQAVPFVGNAQRQPSAADTVYGGLKQGSDALMGYGAQAVDNIGRSVGQLGDYLATPANAAIHAPEGIHAPAQQQGLPISSVADTALAPKAAPQAQANPAPKLGVNFTDKGGVSTLSGDNFSVSSSAPGLGAFSTPESLSALDKTIVYNSTPEAKAQFAQNAALSQARYDDLARSNERDRYNQLFAQAATAPNAATQGIGDFLATKAQQKSAVGALGLMKDQQTLAQNQSQFDTTQKTAANTAKAASDLEYLKLAKPDFTATDTYNEFGQKDGQDLYMGGIDGSGKPYAKKVQGTDRMGQIHADFRAKLGEHLNSPNLADTLRKMLAKYDEAAQQGG